MIQSVDGLDDAIRRARNVTAGLRVQQAAYDEMVAAGKAPEAPPSDVTLID